MRAGIFSASQVYRLAKDGRKKGEPSAQFYSYVTEKFYEMTLGCALGDDQKSRYTEWGNEMERYVAGRSMMKARWHHKLEDRLYNYDLHLTGELDFSVGEDIIELKCPFTKKSFCDLAVSLLEGTLKDTHEDYYWQLVAQKILFDGQKTSLAVFMPQESQKSEVMAHLEGTYFHGWNPDELPFLRVNGFIRGNVIIPDEDIQHLINRLKIGKESLISLFKQKQKWVKSISI